MRSILAGMAAVAVALACPAAEAGDGRSEAGVLAFGVFSHSSGVDDRVTVLTAPAGTSFGQIAPGLYLQRMLTDHLAIEPQVSGAAYYGGGSGLGGDSLTVYSLRLRANYLFGGLERPTPYVFAGGGLWHFGSEGHGETHSLAGAGVGWRRPVGSSGSVRLEGGYERQNGDVDTSVWGGAVGLALRF